MSFSTSMSIGAWLQGASSRILPAAGAAGESKSARAQSLVYEGRAGALEAYARSRVSMAENPLFRGDALGGLESTSGRIQALMAEITNLMRAGGNVGSLSGVLSRLDSASALIDKAMAELGRNAPDAQNDAVSNAPRANPKAAALQKVAETGSLSPDEAVEALGIKEPLQKLETIYLGLDEQVHGLVGARLFLAHVAITMDVPDMAVFIMQKAYGDIRWLLDGLISALGNRKPTPKLQNVIDSLKGLKEKVISTLILALSSHGGPMLTPQEAEAMLVPESDFDSDKNPVAKQILKHFNLIQSRDELKKFTLSAMEKIIGKLPEVLTNVSNTLQGLRNDPGAGIGSAFTQIMPALGRLDLAKALLRIATSGMQNGFKAAAAGSANLTQYEGMIRQLEQLADTIFGELETRSFVRSRNMNKPLLPEQEPEPAGTPPDESRDKAGTQRLQGPEHLSPPAPDNPADLLRATDPLAQADMALYALFGAPAPGGTASSGAITGLANGNGFFGFSLAPDVHNARAGHLSLEGGLSAKG